jgi:hypothetical protein
MPTPNRRSKQTCGWVWSANKVKSVNKVREKAIKSQLLSEGQIKHVVVFGEQIM